eukprot:CAMPEP_0169262836 /NCGR_PEP_ID=MMETSP1016-20121227/43976_1 /TAXON_ID=342587 /ORGANISM="Karlodinium micrum, Strain CCMP2283" /LENGTH=47 /DNA_ID= /DNA_START= /DNA_END= /DNA_ORIENTATION=
MTEEEATEEEMMREEMTEEDAVMIERNAAMTEEEDADTIVGIAVVAE